MRAFAIAYVHGSSSIAHLSKGVSDRRVLKDSVFCMSNCSNSPVRSVDGSVGPTMRDLLKAFFTLALAMSSSPVGILVPCRKVTRATRVLRPYSWVAKAVTFLDSHNMPSLVCQGGFWMSRSIWMVGLGSGGIAGSGGSGGGRSGHGRLVVMRLLLPSGPG